MTTSAVFSRGSYGVTGHSEGIGPMRGDEAVRVPHGLPVEDHSP